MTDLQCKACQRVLSDPNALYQHLRDAHAGPRSGKKAVRKRYRAAARKAVDDAREPSMADLMVEAEIAMACGEPVDEFAMAVFGEYLSGGCCADPI